MTVNATNAAIVGIIREERRIVVHCHDGYDFCPVCAVKRLARGEAMDRRSLFRVSAGQVACTDCLDVMESNGQWPATEALLKGK